MKKKPELKDTDDLRAEYQPSDFPTLVRGKYTGRVRQSSNVVVIDPDVSTYFPNAESANAALRSLAEIANRARPARRRT